MKKILFSLFALIILISGCEKNETDAVPLDVVSWNVVNTNLTGIGDNVSTFEIYSDYELSANNVKVAANGETVSNTVVYSGNKAVFTIKTTGVKYYHIDYTFNDGTATSFNIPTIRNTK